MNEKAGLCPLKTFSKPSAESRGTEWRGKAALLHSAAAPPAGGCRSWPGPARPWRVLRPEMGGGIMGTAAPASGRPWLGAYGFSALGGAGPVFYALLFLPRTVPAAPAGGCDAVGDVVQSQPAGRRLLRRPTGAVWRRYSPDCGGCIAPGRCGVRRYFTFPAG